MTFRLLFSHEDASPPGKPLDNDQLSALYAPPQRMWMRINIVQSINGSIVGTDGTSNSLTTPQDRTLLHVIRRHSDVIMVGARTVIAEGLYSTKGTPTAVLCGASSLAALTLPRAIKGQIILLVPESAYARAHKRWTDDQIHVVSLPEPHPGHTSIEAALSHIRARGFETITCEGGAHLAGALLSSHHVDELCLTVSPTFVSPAHSVQLTPSPATRSFTLTHTMVDTASTLYTRWSRNSSSSRTTPSSPPPQPARLAATEQRNA